MGMLVVFDITMSVMHCCSCNGGGTAAVPGTGSAMDNGGPAVAGGPADGGPEGTVSSLYVMHADDKRGAGSSAASALQQPQQQQVVVMHCMSDA